MSNWMIDSPFSTTRIPPLVFGPGSRTSLAAHVDRVVWAGDVSGHNDGHKLPRTPARSRTAGTTDAGGASSTFRPVLLISGRTISQSTYFAEIVDDLAARFEVDHVGVHGEPSPEQVNEIVELRRTSPPHLVIAVGGGSTLDTGKAVAAGFALDGPIEDYLEGVGDKSPHGAKLPFVALPTTAGTGSEATKNAVLSRIAASGGFKKSLRHDNYVPDLALVDPELCVACPRPVTAASGLDAFTQLLEAYLSTGATPFTDALCESGIHAFASGFHKVLNNGSDVIARSSLSYAAFLSGVTLATAGLGLVHGLASPIGARAPVPHGVVCGALLSPVLRAGFPDLGVATVRKLARVSDLIEDAEDGAERADAAEQLTEGTADANQAAGARRTGAEGATVRARAEAALAAIDGWVAAAGLPRFGDFGLDEAAARAAADEAGHKNHPARLDQTTVETIVLSCL